MKKLTVGIAGYGVIGKRRNHYIDLNPNLKTVSICDHMIDQININNKNLKAFNNIDEMIQNIQLDILFVCLSNDVAAETVIKGLKAGLHVFCEKPPGRNLKEILDIISIEKECPNQRLMYGFNHRYHDSVKEALNIIRKKEFGSVINLRGIYGKSKIIDYNSNWRTQRKIAGGGILLDQGIHIVDLMRLFAGEFEQIYSFISNDFWKHDVEDNAYALMKTKDNVVAVLHSSATQWRHKFQLDITLEKGQLILAGILSGTKSYGAETLTIVQAGEFDSGDPKEIMIRYNSDPSWKDEIEYFTNCIINNKAIETSSSIDAYKTMETVFRIYCADKNWSEKYNITLE
ncbi:Gfo/Idh/MocA family protein [Fluviispira multicolorata]|uniref:Gfo/Idh/MocA family oxidoreductase n=1 Tax=Fluviispira multicolorata TaxID=2654512 RepID=A0A833JD38_9BACT|nr:Gfo/Idh/MocA family oxidoreductase [Fluviispira multicolorata]KAB8028037.1 gfo/Idh/MocA family oxidoreductase [Fluviispira multicolorata]